MKIVKTANVERRTEVPQKDGSIRQEANSSKLGELRSHRSYLPSSKDKPVAKCGCT